MKAKALQFGKAMSAALFVLLLVVVGSKNALAQTQVATLQHGEDISVFYGTNAFVSAHSAAADGDIVTLSSGSFTVPSSITKAITLRGAGVVSDSLAGTAPTIFAQQVVINVSNDSIPFQVEGILFTGVMQYGTMYNPKFTRCSFNKISWYSNSYTMRNAQFVNCMIKEFDFYIATNTTLINSVVWYPTYITTSRSVLLYNSIMRLVNNSYELEGLSAFNSIFIRDNNSNNYAYYPLSNCTFFNCIGIKTGQYAPFGSAYTSGCTTYSSYQEVFESFTGTFSLEEPFILKDEIATGFLGSDGTQVGIHGGFMPYSNRPSYMVLKRCNVANKSTIDGKLSVEIEVVTEE
jgi:hypothetical protein